MNTAPNRFLQGAGACLALILRSKSRWLLWSPGIASGLLLAIFPPSSWCQATVPEFFGIYAVVDGKLAALIGGKGSFVPGQTELQLYDFQRMSANTENVLVFEGKDIRFAVFDAAVADTSASLELYKLPYGRNLITRPDGLAQVGTLLDGVTGRARSGNQPQSPPSSPLQKYVVAKTDALKLELLQKPVPGQAQMVQLVPASDIEPGMYSLFAIRSQGGQRVIVRQVFEWKGRSGSATAPYCIDLAMTGGFGGVIDESDARMMRPYYLAKEKFVNCASSSNTLNSPPSANPSRTRGTAEFTSESSAWDKALSLGQSVAIEVCYNRGGFVVRACNQGTLSLGSKEISFSQSDGQKLFAVPPSEVKIKPIVRNPRVPIFVLQAVGKDWGFQFVPLGVDCPQRFQGYLVCPPEGAAQQEAAADYVPRAVRKLASGSFDAPPQQ